MVDARLIDLDIDEVIRKMNATKVDRQKMYISENLYRAILKKEGLTQDQIEEKVKALKESKNDG